MFAKIQTLILVAISWLVQFCFLLYRALPIGLPLMVLFTLLDKWLLAGRFSFCAWTSAGLISIALAVATRRNPIKDNPYRVYSGWTGWLDKKVDGLIAWIGTIKLFKSPFCLVEDSSAYKVRGEEVRKLIDDVLRPGDILLRGFDGYLDGALIKLSGSKAGPGSEFSHAAIFLGDVNSTTDQAIAARRLQVLDPQGNWVKAAEPQKDAVRTNPQYFSPGRQRVAHAMTRGVFTEDILTFLRCDYIAVLRLPDAFKLAPEEVNQYGDRSLIADLPDDAAAIRQSLLQGETVTAAQVIQAVRLSALGKVGSCYDFQFNDAKTNQRFSCSEFAYYCYKSVHCYIGLELKSHGMGPFLVRETITPSDIYQAALTGGKFNIVWPLPN